MSEGSEEKSEKKMESTPKEIDPSPSTEKPVSELATSLVVEILEVVQSNVKSSSSTEDNVKEKHLEQIIVKLDVSENKSNVEVSDKTLESKVSSPKEEVLSVAIEKESANSSSPPSSSLEKKVPSPIGDSVNISSCDQNSPSVEITPSVHVKDVNHHDSMEVDSVTSASIEGSNSSSSEFQPISSPGPSESHDENKMEIDTNPSVDPVPSASTTPMEEG